MADIITLLCPVDAAPGRGAALREALKTLAAATVAEPGNLCYKPHATGDPDRFIIQFHDDHGDGVVQPFRFDPVILHDPVKIKQIDPSQHIVVIGFLGVFKTDLIPSSVSFEDLRQR